MGIEWGRRIDTPNGRPAWLHDKVRLMHLDAKGIWSGHDTEWYPEQISPVGWQNDTPAIRLPADHFAYLAIAQGYEPWGGGERAPDDWDGKHALRDDGSDIFAPFLFSGWQRGEFANHVIGYRKRAWTKGAPFEQEVTPPALAQMTAREARMLWARCATGDLSVLEPRGMTAQDAAVRMLGHLGLIRPDRTPLEQFLAEHPEADPATADLAIKWARAE